MKAWIFCQGSREIGLGHVTRCLEIAKKFRRAHIDSCFIVNNNQHCREKIEFHGFHQKIFSDTREIPKLLGDARAGFFLSDCNEAKRSDILTMTQILPVVNIAVQGQSKWYADVSYVHSPFMDSKKPEDARGSIHAGPEYAPLGEKFEQLHPMSTRRNAVKRILISMGGGDAMGFTQVALRALAAVHDLDFEVLVIVGPAYGNTSKLKAELERFPHPYDLVQNSPDMAEMMLKCDLALLAMGTTTYEACCLGLPSINICPSDFHDQLARLFERRGLLINAGRLNEDSERFIADTLRLLAKDHEKLAEISHRAWDAVDGQGISRILDGIRMAYQEGCKFS